VKQNDAGFGGVNEVSEKFTFQNERTEEQLAAISLVLTYIQDTYKYHINFVCRCMYLTIVSLRYRALHFYQ